jgi:hypothetical protein
MDTKITMDDIFKGIETILFCDESKFYINNGDAEDAIYYFGIAVDKRKVPSVDREIKEIIKKHKIKTEVFHATTIFKEDRPRSPFMDDFTKIIINNRLHCFCHKYSKSLLFEATKNLMKFNNDILKFDNVEFQALFYFLNTLNIYLKDTKPKLVKREILMYFDRNVYGSIEIEAFNFPSNDFILKQMTFSEKSQISLLSLPDFFGYIFRKSKISHNKVQFGDKRIESSRLVINSFKCLMEINDAKLFHLLEVDKRIIEKAIEAFTS